jgi:phosphoglycerol transferase
MRTISIRLAISAWLLWVAMYAPCLPAQSALPVFAEPIDFSKQQLPAYVSGTKGLSPPEPWGRWTDAAVATIRFSRPLPEKFDVVIVYWAVYGPNRGLPFKVRIGDEVREFTLSTGTEKVRLPFNPGRTVDTIDIEVPKPTSPASLGKSADQRPLGLGLNRLHIIPRS